MMIDYTNYCDKNLTVETGRAKIKETYDNLRDALEQEGVHGKIQVVYYTDGKAKVSIDGKYYNMFDKDNGWFNGFVGDSK